MTPQKLWTWNKGTFTPAGAESLLHDKGLLLGDSVFTTLRLCRGMPAFLELHLKRLNTSLAHFGFPGQLSPHDLLPLLDTLALPKEGSLRLTVTRGPGPRGLQRPDPQCPHLLMQATPSQSAPTSQAPLKVCTADFPIPPLLWGHKTGGGYLALSVLLHNIQQQGYEEALCFAADGHLVSGLQSAVFFIDETTLILPSLSPAALPSISRQILPDLARDAGLTVKERPIMRSDAPSLPAGFLCNSLTGPRALGWLEGHELIVPDMVARLKSAYHAACEAAVLRAFK